MTILYFAYGSNMAEDTLRKRVPSARMVGAARVDGYRLAFNRLSARTQTGVANIVEDADFSVWGVAFEIEEYDLPELEKKEGVGLHPPAYRRQDIIAYLYDTKKRANSLSFTVAQPEEDEFVPSQEYLQSMIDVMSQLKMGKYLQFLRWIQERCIAASSRQPGDILSRPGLLVTRVRNTSLVRGGAPVVMLSPENIGRVPRYVALDFDRRTAVGYAVVDGTVKRGRCALEQTLRGALGIGGQMVYGQTVSVHRIRGRLATGVQTRTLTLNLSQARLGDAENNICVVHQRNLELLGVQSGEFISLHRPGSTGAGFKDFRLVLRCFAAADDGKPGYPDPTRIYLDGDGRMRLGITSEASEYLDSPILIRPSISKAIQARIVAYGITVLLGASTFTDLAGRLFGHIGKFGIGAIGLGVAVALALALAYIDLRSKMHS